MTMRSVADLLDAYRAGSCVLVDVVRDVFDRIEGEGLAPVWISLADRDRALRRAATVDRSLPLAGVPFAVKDNIDVEGLPTTAGCPSFAYRPQRSATVVRRLEDAGAILIGKTNLDQFATGLVGMRSPYGACENVFDDRFISGGSSSGSAVAVAKGLCAFALGTDTAGSGRVPAAFNNLVGLKPTRGLVSTTGVVPACRSLDCVSIFASNATDASAVLAIAQAFDAEDPYSRTVSAGADAAPWVNGTFRFGMPTARLLEFFDDRESAGLYEAAAERLESLGGVRVAIDYTPFLEVAELLYSGPWLAERFAAVGDFLEAEPADAHPDIQPVVAGIIRAGARYTAVDAHRAAYALKKLKREAAREWAAIDVLFLPTAGTIYTREAVEADPVRLNANLGYYTNFVNLMDLAAIAVPAAFRTDGLPFGVSLIGPAFSDRALIALAQRFLGESAGAPLDAPGCISVAVVGAHLSGQPLNHQLTARGARLVRAGRTSRHYRLYLLAGTAPPKPALVRDPDGEGEGIDLEIWTVPEDRFGSFVADVPHPLAIGNVELDSGEWVKGFVCEPVAIRGADEITRFAGWRQFLASRR
jgi:allophanate hydrolase